MKVVANEKLIKRNARIGTYTNIAAVIILVGGLAISLLRKDLFWVSAVTLVFGFALSQFSFFYINRFGRHPRLDEHVSGSLKGLSNDFSLYQYNTPASHLLVGPAGVWVILPYYQRGTIVYEGGRWKQRGGGLAASYMKIFAQEGLGRPDLEVAADIAGIQEFFQKRLEGEAVPLVNAALLFVDKRADLQAEDAPVPTLRPGGMKELIRRAARERPFPPDEIKRLRAILPQSESPDLKHEGPATKRK
jgi:hypothetical protein